MVYYDCYIILVVDIVTKKFEGHSYGVAERITLLSGNVTRGNWFYRNFLGKVSIVMPVKEASIAVQQELG
jgi:hypothetical protein